MSKFLSLLCSMLICVATYAQNITVNGKVTANGEEMPGVTVAVKGGTNGTITSIDGSYSLQVDAKSTLVFSFIGYETVEMPVKGQKVINVDLKESSVAIDEVVIAVPYGTAKKSTFTGSASVIDKKIVAASQVSSVSKALQGTVAGLQSFSTSGQPGEDADIYIRGVGSANASQTPLYVVDGVPYDGTFIYFFTRYCFCYSFERCRCCFSLWFSCSKRCHHDYDQTRTEWFSPNYPVIG